MQLPVRRYFMVALAAAALMAHQPAMSQAARSSSGNAQAMQQLQQLAAERTKLLADNAKLQSELAEVRKERDSMKKKQDAAERSQKGNDVAVARATARSDSLAQDLEREKGRMAELVAKFRETVSQFREVEGDRNTVKAALGQREAELKQCVDRNVSLYALNGEILTRLEHPRGLSASSPLEPFTKLKRVELENLVDGYQTRADEQRPPAASLQSPASR